MGYLYTFDIGIRPDHMIVKSGPYKYLAHPGYFGQLTTLIGAIFFFNISIILALLICVKLCIDYKKRITEEERFLTEKFGVEYKNYLSSVYHIIPYIW